MCMNSLDGENFPIHRQSSVFLQWAIIYLLKYFSLWTNSKAHYNDIIVNLDTDIAVRNTPHQLKVAYTNFKDSIFKILIKTLMIWKL